MLEATVRTTASTGAIWVIVVVAVVCLAFWLGTVLWMGEHPLWPQHRAPDMPGPVLGGVHLAEGGRSVSPNRVAPATFTEPVPGVPAQRGTAPASEPARFNVPGLPAQRGGTADKPEGSDAAPGTTGRRGEG
jgi:hypothetical protein